MWNAEYDELPREPPWFEVTCACGVTRRNDENCEVCSTRSYQSADAEDWNRWVDKNARGGW